MAEPMRGTLEIPKKRKMRKFGHGTRHPDDFELAHTIMHARVLGKRARGRPQRN